MVKLVSNRISGVKNLVSSTVSLLREVPLSQVKSPNANGVKLSTPGVASGACRASGIVGAAGAGGAAAGCWGAVAGVGIPGAGVEATGAPPSGALAASAGASAGCADAERACNAASSCEMRCFSAASSSSTAVTVASAEAGEALAFGTAALSAASRKSTRRVPGGATYTLAVESAKPSLDAATSYSPGSSPGMVNVPSEPLVAVRSVPLFRLCAVIRTCANGCLLAESRVTPPTAPNMSCPAAGMGSAAIWKAMQAGKTAETSKL